MATIQKNRQKIIDRNYYLSSHAEDEMLDDRLERGVNTPFSKERLRSDSRKTSGEQDIGLRDQQWMAE
jgi:hypothetical protein